ncbi:hypothetical protein KC614_01930 [candidate division WWE3 bacterium]|uniref:Carboxypeptidase regulatory-like domain-containing protein n=1 Tax=candidate division WWE3 bacterium TaxID=2053526 RepID=A0A955LKG8_UNCKA|nr:hypothetical protein [candidate division WWE3 bacterium]
MFAAKVVKPKVLVVFLLLVIFSSLVFFKAIQQPKFIQDNTNKPSLASVKDDIDLSAFDNQNATESNEDYAPNNIFDEPQVAGAIVLTTQKPTTQTQTSTSSDQSNNNSNSNGDNTNDQQNTDNNDDEQTSTPAPTNAPSSEPTPTTQPEPTVYAINPTVEPTPAGGGMPEVTPTPTTPQPTQNPTPTVTPMPTPTQTPTPTPSPTVSIGVIRVGIRDQFGEFAPPTPIVLIDSLGNVQRVTTGFGGSQYFYDLPLGRVDVHVLNYHQVIYITNSVLKYADFQINVPIPNSDWVEYMPAYYPGNNISVRFDWHLMTPYGWTCMFYNENHEAIIDYELACPSVYGFWLEGFPRGETHFFTVEAYRKYDNEGHLLPVDERPTYNAMVWVTMPE